jgi:hypothetical protein
MLIKGKWYVAPSSPDDILVGDRVRLVWDGKYGTVTDTLGNTVEVTIGRTRKVRHYCAWTEVGFVRCVSSRPKVL